MATTWPCGFSNHRLENTGDNSISFPILSPPKSKEICFCWWLQDRISSSAGPAWCSVDHVPLGLETVILMYRVSRLPESTTAKVLRFAYTERISNEKCVDEFKIRLDSVWLSTIGFFKCIIQVNIYISCVRIDWYTHCKHKHCKIWWFYLSCVLQTYL